MPHSTAPPAWTLDGSKMEQVCLHHPFLHFSITRAFLSLVCAQPQSNLGTSIWKMTGKTPDPQSHKGPRRVTDRVPSSNLRLQSWSCTEDQGKPRKPCFLQEVAGQERPHIQGLTRHMADRSALRGRLCGGLPDLRGIPRTTSVSPRHSQHFPWGAEGSRTHTLVCSSRAFFGLFITSGAGVLLRYTWVLHSLRDCRGRVQEAGGI